MVNESSLVDDKDDENRNSTRKKIEKLRDDKVDETTSKLSSSNIKLCDKSEEDDSVREIDQRKSAESSIFKKIDEPVVVVSTFELQTKQ